jgi:predicted transposase YbfD/YdcC
MVSVKDNRPQLLAEALNALENVSPARLGIHVDPPEIGHGRIVTRGIKTFPFKPGNPVFATVNSAMLIHRHTVEKLTGKTSDEDELYMSSLPAGAKRAKCCLDITRAHWHIEVLHHVKDRTLKEDRCTAQGATAVNMSTLRSLAVDLLRKTARYAPRASDAFKANVQKAIDLVMSRKPRI